MATDATVLAIGVEAKGVQAATADLAKLSDQAKKTEGATKGLSNSFNSHQSALAKTEQANNALVESWAREVAMLGKTKSEMMGLEAQMRGFNAAQMANVNTLQGQIKAHEDSAKAAKANADSQSAAAERVAKGIGIISTVATAAATALAAMYGLSVKSAMEAEQASLRLEAVLKATGGAANVTKQQIDALADSMAQTTKFDDESLRVAAGTLLTFGQVGVTAFERTLRAGADLAAFMNTDLDSAVRMIGKALEDPEVGMTALRRAGVMLTESQTELAKAAVEAGDKMKAQEVILGALEGKVGGVAEKMNSGLAKATSDAAKAFGELAESIGKTDAVGGSFLTFMDAATKSMAFLKGLIDNGAWFISPFSSAQDLRNLGRQKTDESPAETARYAAEVRKAAEAEEYLANATNMARKAAEASIIASGKKLDADTKAAGATRAHTKAVDDYLDTMKRFDTQQKGETAASKERLEWFAKVDAGLDKIYEAEAKNVAAIDKATDAYQKQLDQLTMTEEALLQKTAAQLADNIAQIEAIAGSDDNTEAMRRQLDVINQLLDAKGKDATTKAAAEQAKAAADEWKRTANSIESSLTDALMRGFEGGKDWAKNFGETLKNMFGSLVLRLIIKAVLAPVAGGAASLFSGSASASGGGGLGSIGGLGSLFGGTAFGSGASISMSNISQLGLFGGTAANFGNIGGQLAAGSFGTAAGMALPYIGAAVAVGSLLYSLLGNRNPSKVRGQFQVGGSGFEDNAFVKSRFGSLGFADAGTQQFSGEAAKSFSKIVADLLDAAADQMDAGQVARVAEKLNATIFEGLEGTFTTQDFLSKYGADILQQTVSVAFDELNPRLAELMRAFEGSAEEMGGYAERLIQTQAFIGQAAEAYGGIYAKLSADDVLALAESFGGLGNVMSATDGYMSALYSDTERLAMTADALQRQFAALGVSMPESKEAFRGLVEGLDLTTEEGRSLLENMLSLAPAFGAVSDAAAESAKKLEDAAKQLRSDNTAFALARASTDVERATIGRDDSINQYLLKDPARLVDFNTKYGGDYSRYGQEIASNMSSQEFSKFGEEDRAGLIGIIKAVGDLEAAALKARDGTKELNGGIRNFYDRVEDGTKSLDKAKEIAAARAQMEIRVMQLSGDAEGALAASRAIEIKALDASLRPLQERIYALEDDAAATQIANTARQLEIQAMRLSGDAAGAMASSRALELEALDESLRPLQERIYALEDDAKAQDLANTSRGQEIEIMRLSGDLAGALAAARELELASMDESLRPLQERIYALKDAEEEESVAAVRDRLRIEQLRLEGDATSALVAERYLELEALPKSVHELQAYVWTLQDQKTAQEEANTIRGQEIEAMRLAGKEEEALIAQRDLERQTMDKVLLPGQEMIWLLEDQAKAQDLSNTLRSQEIEAMRLSGKSAEALQAQRDLERETTEQALLPGKELIWQLEDQAAAQDLANTLRGQEIEAMRLSGESIEALQAQRELERQTMDKALLPGQELIWTLQDQKTAQDEANAIRSQEIEVLRLSGKSVEALTAQRDLERQTMDKVLLPKQEEIWALQDQANAQDIANTIRGQEIEAMRLSGKSAEALIAQRELERTTTDAALLPGKELVWQLEDQATAQDLANTLRGQEIEAMQLSGKSVEALAAQRDLERQTMDKALLPGQELIWTLQDQATAQDLANTLRLQEIEAMQLSGKSIEALTAQRDLERQTTSAALLPGKELIWQLQDQVDAQDLANTLRGQEIEAMRLAGREADALIAQRELERTTTSAALLPGKELIWQLQDQANAQDMANTIRGQEIEVLRLSGKETEALTAQRELERQTTDKALLVGKELIWQAQDKAKADEAALLAAQKAADEAERAAKQAEQLAAARRQLEIRIMELSGDAIGALAASRALELAGMDESLRPLQERIWALEDATETENAATDAIRNREGAIIKARGELTTAYQRESGVLRETADRFRAFGISLRQFRDGLTVGKLSPLGPEALLKQSKALFQGTAQAAMSGDERAIGRLQDVASQYLETARDYFASSTGYVEAFNSVVGVLDTVAADSEFQASTAEQQLSMLDTQVRGLVEIDTSVKSVEQAVRELIGLMQQQSTKVDVTASLSQISNGFANQVTSIVESSNKRLVAQMVD